MSRETPDVQQGNRKGCHYKGCFNAGTGLVPAQIARNADVFNFSNINITNYISQNSKGLA